MKIKGFTLLELLVVIIILIILIGVAIVAVNPGRQIKRANTATRWTNVSVIANAVAQKIIDEGGSWNCPTCSVTTTAVEISKTTCDLCVCIVPDYLGTLPSDPINGSPPGQVLNCTDSYSTRYSIKWSTTTPSSYPKVTVTSLEEPGISVTR